MKKVLLIDVDSKIPNIALMKLSTYYKSRGYGITFKKLNYDGYPHKRNSTIIVADNYDKVFISVIFTQNKNVISICGCDDISYGGSGYDLNIKLKKEIDDCNPDYSIYPDNKCSYGFITRGCVKNCNYCIVREKEGILYKYRDVKDVATHKINVFLDNNILAYKDHIEVLQYLVDNKIKCQFSQGLDIKFLTEENAKLISELNYYGDVTFAFDNINDYDIVQKNTQIIKKYIFKPWRIKMYLYIHPKNEIKDDIYLRIRWCKENKILPYIMRDASCWKDINCKLYTDFASYCNQPRFFRTLTFPEYLKAKHPNNKKRVDDHIKLIS